MKAIQLALKVTEREKQPVLYTDSWVVANALWGWLEQEKETNCQDRGEPVWIAALWYEGISGMRSRWNRMVRGYLDVLDNVGDEQNTNGME